MNSEKKNRPCSGLFQLQQRGWYYAARPRRVLDRLGVFLRVSELSSSPSPEISSSDSIYSSVSSSSSSIPMRSGFSFLLKDSIFLAVCSSSFRFWLRSLEAFL